MVSVTLFLSFLCISTSCILYVWWNRHNDLFSIYKYVFCVDIKKYLSCMDDLKIYFDKYINTKTKEYKKIHAIFVCGCIFYFLAWCSLLSLFPDGEQIKNILIIALFPTFILPWIGIGIFYVMEKFFSRLEPDFIKNAYLNLEKHSINEFFTECEKEKKEWKELYNITRIYDYNSIYERYLELCDSMKIYSGKG